jgi:hypothetical protein
MINSMTNSNSLILADVLLSSLHSYRMALFLSPALACAASALTIRLPRAVPLRCVCAWVPYSPWTPAQMLLSFVEAQLSGHFCVATDPQLVVETQPQGGLVVWDR